MGVVTHDEEQWEAEMDADGKPWSWRDVAELVSFRRFGSMHRMLLMLGVIERELTAGRPKAARVAMIQSMKPVHQVSLDGHWATAWRFTGLPDPNVKPRRGATPLDLKPRRFPARLCRA